MPKSKSGGQGIGSGDLSQLFKIEFEENAKKVSPNAKTSVWGQVRKIRVGPLLEKAG